MSPIQLTEREQTMDKAAILSALIIGQKYADKAKLDMLCKAGAYSDRELRVVQQESYWKGVMADCKAIDAAIEAVKQS